MAKETVREHIQKVHQHEVAHRADVGEACDEITKSLDKGEVDKSTMLHHFARIAKAFHTSSEFHAKCMGECEKAFEADEMEKAEAIADVIKQELAKLQGEQLTTGRVSAVAPPRVVPRNGQPTKQQGPEYSGIRKIFDEPADDRGMV